MIDCKELAPVQPAGWQLGFLELLPAIHRQLGFAFRVLPRHDRQEAVQEAVANAFVAYVRLVEQGKQSVAYATPLARYAVRQMRAGRRIGGQLNGRDVLSEYCQQRQGVKLESLTEQDPRHGQWKERLVEDHRATPADLVAIKLDFQAWLDSLPAQRRAITETLASGESTRQTAQRFGISTARVSQLRQELQAAWRQFQGELEPFDALLLVGSVA
jgi:DNA-directed RNA polymerase specialized sigma24 family protein